MKWPPKEKPQLDGEGLSKLTTATAYRVLDLLQAPFGFMFWLIERRNARLQNTIDTEGATDDRHR
jgi:hypothetical protein